MANWSYQQSREELEGTSSDIQSHGVQAPTLFRPPYGETSSTLSQVAQDLGMRVITWDADSKDWDNAGSSEIANAAGQLQNGQIILMHDASYHQNTINAISQIASTLRAKGLCAGRIDPSTGRAVAPSQGSSDNTSNVNNNNSNIGNVDSNSANPDGSGSNVILVRALGIVGDEHINLKVGGEVVTSWTLSTGYQDYTYRTNASGEISVEYDNDSGDRDIRIDYINVNGDTGQA